jgi:type IV secretion system protein VirB6
MLSHIVNPRTGKAMGIGTLAADLNSIYGFALTASARIEESSTASAIAPVPQPAPEEGEAPAHRAPAPMIKSGVDNPLASPMKSTIQAAIIWIAAALFVGYAVALLLFAKIALWVLLALAPFFIMLLMFQIPSRFFSGWLTGMIQVILIPVFLSTFLSFYNLGIQDAVKALALSIAKDGVPALKDAGPFVLVCLIGFFLLVQIVPLSARIAASSQEWFTNAASRAGSAGSNIVSAMAGGMARKIHRKSLRSHQRRDNSDKHILAKRTCARCKTEVQRLTGKAETDKESGRSDDRIDQSFLPRKTIRQSEAILDRLAGSNA